MHIVTIVGARPQFIKASAFSRALKDLEIPEVIIHTGQHFDDNMADIFFRQMEIPEPSYNLGIHSMNHGAMTGRMMEEIEKILLQEKPNAVVVFGDTNSTLAGALAASKLHIPIAHVEAGLRSFNMQMPEEVNRILTDRISSFLFCPTAVAVQHLEQEGCNHWNSEVFLTGDIMYDVALHYGRIASKQSDIIRRLSLMDKPFLLVTLHRQENTDDKSRLREIVDALHQLAMHYRIIMPLHPRTRNVIRDLDLRLPFDPIDPVGYLDMVELLRNCAFVITDSGGLQKEAYFYGKYCLVTRNETEWTELVDMNYNFLVGASRHLILEKARQIKHLSGTFDEMPYGSGDAAIKMAQILKNNC